MGMEVSYHVIDREFLQSRVFAHVRGERSLDDLEPRVLQSLKNRLRAAAWGLDLFHLQQPVLGAQWKAGQPGDGVPGFKTDLHVWGRPFFIVHDESERISAAIDAYLEADSEAAVDEIALEMITVLDDRIRTAPPFTGVDRLPVPLTEHVVPAANDCVADAEFVDCARTKLDLFREAFAAIREGRNDVVDARGQTHNARDVFAADFPAAAIEFASLFRPGWTARGYVWPTLLLSRVNAPTAEIVETPASLFQPIINVAPETEKEFSLTIEANHSLGGYVPAEKVADFQNLLEDHIPAIEAWTQAEDWDEGESTFEINKCLEAVRDAERRGMGFLEAAKTYNGLTGNMSFTGAALVPVPG